MKKPSSGMQPAPDAGGPKPGAAKSGAPSAGSPKPAAPKTGTPKAGLPKAGSPKTGTPKAGLPRVAASKPGTPKPTPAKVAAPKPAAKLPEPGAPAGKAAASSSASTKAARSFLPIAAWVEKLSHPRRRLVTPLRWTLLFSLMLHLAITPLIPEPQEGLAEKEELFQTEYQKKIEAAKAARITAQSVQRRLTMPEPPPVPEAVVEETLTSSLTSGIDAVMGDLLPVKALDSIKGQVAADLKTELAEASKRIVHEKLSKEEIEKLHQEFKEKTHKLTVSKLREYRVETQTERAAMSTLEWYEQCFADNMVYGMQYELYKPASFDRRSKSPLYHGHIYNAWENIFNSRFNATGSLNWADLFANECLRERLSDLDNLKRLRSDWDSKTQAANLVSKLSRAYRGDSRVASFRQIVGGGVDTHEVETKQDNVVGTRLQVHRTDGLIRDYYPHDQEAKARLQAGYKGCDELFQRALAAAQQYEKTAADPSSEDHVEAAKNACVAAIGELRDALSKFVVPDEEAKLKRTVNHILRNRMLSGPLCKEMHEYVVGHILQGMAPLIEKLLRAQFEKGILVHKDGVDQAIKEFSEQSQPLLKRDIEKVIPWGWFQSEVFCAKAPYRSYASKVPGQVRYVPNAEELQKEAQELQELLAKHTNLKSYAAQREEVLAKRFKITLTEIGDRLIREASTGDLLTRKLSEFVEGVDYADEVEQKLDARAAALKGRGQDLANLTPEGIPATSANLMLLAFGGGRGQQAGLQAVVAPSQPGFLAYSRPMQAMRSGMPSLAAAAGKYGFERQAEVQPAFGTPRFEAIPFLPNYPNLDGDLRDWGHIRPLVVPPADGKGEPVLVYAGWNYQGFYFGYSVAQSAKRFLYPEPSQVSTKIDRLNRASISTQKSKDATWAYKADALQLLFDTLDARDETRGDPHTQEFIVFPCGTNSDAECPGGERMFASKRDASKKSYRGAKDFFEVFPKQPPPEQGPDGSGPYRVARLGPEGYTVEIFLPRSLFNTPVFAPGWNIGFDCVVRTGSDERYARAWACKDNSEARSTGLAPNRWGDLLMLGTDANVFVQDTDGKLSQCIIPGHSYLVTVVDPDRNLHLTQEDTVVVTVEAADGQNPKDESGDVEVYLLKETGPNTSIFRGYVDTEPGRGWQVQRSVEIMPGQVVRFGYVDVANAQGQRNVVKDLRLPVVSGMLRSRK